MGSQFVSEFKDLINNIRNIIKEGYDIDTLLKDIETYIVILNKVNTSVHTIELLINVTISNLNETKKCYN